MTVICLSNCPPRVRGDLSKWLMEINTGVYVGRISARVRDELWRRITENIRSGQATMVYRTSGEQHMDFRVHNTTWQPVDYDGLKLMRRPAIKAAVDTSGIYLPDGFSRAAGFRMARNMRRTAGTNTALAACTILDLETTGLDYEKDNIIEIAALRIRSGSIVAEFHELVLTERTISKKVSDLTGISEELLRSQGQELQAVLASLAAFIGTDKLICWNSPFDMAFLQRGCSSCGMPIIRNKSVDAMKLAKKKLSDLSDYRLAAVARHLGVNIAVTHRALADCRLTYAILSKLNEKAPD